MKIAGVLSSARTIATAATVMLIAGCGGGSSASGSHASIPDSGTAASRSVTLTIRIPTAAAPGASSRHTSYVASTTASLSMTITSGSTTALAQSVALTPGTNPNCVSAAGVTTCTVILGLAPGSYTGTFSTFDGPVVGGAATGHVLSQGQNVAITITSAQTNTIALTLDGVPASIALTIPNSSNITGTQSGGFVVPRGPAGDLTVNALDADGNAIIGAGAPTFSAASSGASFTVTHPSANDFSIAAIAGGSVTLTVTAAPANGGYACGTSGIVCSATAAVTTPHLLFVADQGPYVVKVYTSLNNLAWTLATTITSGIGTPEALATAPNGTLFVGNRGSSGCCSGPSPGNVQVYAPPYTAAPTAISSGIADPESMAVTSTGTLFVANGTSAQSFQHTLQAYAPPWTGTPTTTNLSSTVISLALDVSDNLFVAGGPGALEFLAPSYGAPTTISNSDQGPVTVAPDKTLFVGFSESNIVMYGLGLPPYTGTPVSFTTPGHGGTEFLRSLNLDANGNLWATTAGAGGSDANYVMEWTKPFTNNQVPAVQVPFSGANVLVTDSSGNAITSLNGASITRIAASGALTTIVSSGTNYPVALLYAP